MKIHRQFLRCRIAALALALLASYAHAAEHGTYIGVSAGTTTYSLDTIHGAFPLYQGNIPVTDDSDTAFAVALGYRFSPNFSIEVSYNDLGQMRSSESDFRGSSYYAGVGGSASVAGTGDATFSVGGTALVAIGVVPAGHWEFFCKAGVFFAQTEVEAAVQGQLTRYPPGLSSSPTQATSNESAGTTEVLIGLGVGYTLADHYHLKFDWSRIAAVGDEEETGESDIDALSLGFQYRF